MREMQERIIRELGARPEINPAAEVDARVQFLVDYVKVTGARGLVLGISGGQDSTLAGRLCQLAVERIAGGPSAADVRAVDPSVDDVRAADVRAAGSSTDGGSADGGSAGDGSGDGSSGDGGSDAGVAPVEFIAVRLPYAVQHDEDDAQLALDFIRPQRVVYFNIQAAVDGFATEYGEVLGDPLADFTKGNVKARARMMAQYAIAGQRGLLVVGSDHAAEAVTGFFTKFGDGASDLVPLAGLTKRQGRQMLEALDAPERLYLKPPTADLLDDLPGQTDEASLGLSYAEIDDYLEGREVSDAVARAIESRYVASRHKRRMPASPADTWWR
ncbi:ammonia-dependent NAD(+) synthetase [Homoserinimonas sp. OAct 916]|uniref:ammonia-dependent NAD(+) synthetase n=1 Tax=Homoserinimonas sp. OAct 916 TaxID=2211450 RepID=UPI000DBE2F0F|nr:ammonia-dependent NAD(+) synthetase [Homoserinimonas sp. OAct 916]